MNSTLKVGFVLLALLVLFSGCVQQQQQQQQGTTNTTGNDAVYNQTSQSASDIQTNDLTQLDTQLNEVDTSLNEINSADVGTVDANQ